jgi:hypothetical protein
MVEVSFMSCDVSNSESRKLVERETESVRCGPKVHEIKYPASGTIESARGSPPIRGVPHTVAWDPTLSRQAMLH